MSHELLAGHNEVINHLVKSRLSLIRSGKFIHVLGTEYKKYNGVTRMNSVHLGVVHHTRLDEYLETLEVYVEIPRPSAHLKSERN